MNRQNRCEIQSLIERNPWKTAKPEPKFSVKIGNNVSGLTQVRRDVGPL